MHKLSQLSDSEVLDGDLPSLSPQVRKSILIVAAEPYVRELLALQLRAAGCFPMAVATVAEAKRLAMQVIPDLIVIDMDALPLHEGTWATQLALPPARKVPRTIVLSSDVAQVCAADEAGCAADLCVAKPFEPRELIRQMLRLLRLSRSEVQRPRARPPLKAASIEIDRHEPTVRLHLPGGWRKLDLPPAEHRLLAYLLAGAERTRSREAIRDAVWNDTPVELRTVDQYIRRLRRTLNAAGARNLVKTIIGIGYRLDLDALKRPQT